MRKTCLAVVSLSLCLYGCVPTGDPALRAREERRSPDLTEGTNNPEAAVYRTQILASPPGPAEPAADGNASKEKVPARRPKTSKPEAAPASAN